VVDDDVMKDDFGTDIEERSPNEADVLDPAGRAA
jgi:hypothetical protein